MSLREYERRELLKEARDWERFADWALDNEGSEDARLALETAEMLRRRAEEV